MSSSYILIGIICFILLIIIAIICLFIQILHNDNINDNNKSIAFIICLFFITALMLFICILGYIKFSDYPISLHYHFVYNHLHRLVASRISINDPLIAYLMDLIAFIIFLPDLCLIIYHIYEYVSINNISHMECVERCLLSLINIFVIVAILFIYLILSNKLRIYSQAYSLFPFILGCAGGALIPTAFDVYIRIRLNNINWLNNDIRSRVIRSCLSNSLTALSMLGIAVTFDSLSFTARWPVSVGFMYWGTYIFVIVSLSLIDFGTVYEIENP